LLSTIETVERDKPRWLAKSRKVMGLAAVPGTAAGRTAGNLDLDLVTTSIVSNKQLDRRIEKPVPFPLQSKKLLNRYYNAFIEPV
jgi:hypothetical protein